MTLTELQTALAEVQKTCGGDVPVSMTFVSNAISMWGSKVGTLRVVRYSSGAIGLILVNDLLETTGPAMGKTLQTINLVR